RAFLTATGCAACIVPANSAAIPNTHSHDRGVLMSRSRSETIRAALGHHRVVQPAAIDTGGKHRHRRRVPVVATVAHRSVATVVDHEYQVVHPDLFELRFRNRTRSLGRISDQHAPCKHTLDHHEVVVTVLVHQHNRRQMRLLQFLQRHDESIGFETQRRQESLDVQQRKSFLADLGPIAVREHRRERGLFTHRKAVLVSEQRGNRRGTATEIVFLVNRVAETFFLQRGDVQAVVAPRDPGELGASRPSKYGRHPQQPNKPQQAAFHGCICTFTTVAFWIRTLLPLFWITIGKPAALPNEPPPIQFIPVLTFSVDVLETLPVMAMRSLTLLPPLRLASTELSTPGPRPATAGVTVALSTGAAVVREGGTGFAAKAHSTHAIPTIADVDLQNFPNARISSILHVQRTRSIPTTHPASWGLRPTTRIPRPDSMTDGEVGLHSDALLDQ